MENWERRLIEVQNEIEKIREYEKNILAPSINLSFVSIEEKIKEVHFYFEHLNILEEEKEFLLNIFSLLHGVGIDVSELSSLTKKSILYENGKRT